MDDKTKRGPPDSDLISLGETYEVAYWTKHFSCTESELRAAVKEVGHSKVAVAAYFKKKRGY